MKRSGGRAQPHARPRRWRRGRAATGLALLATTAAVAVLPGQAGAGDLTLAGWWWRAQTGALVTLSAPPQVPEGGFMVAGEPSGATAIAALRFVLDEGEGSPVLVLRVAEGGDQGGETAVLAACVTGSAWSPTEGPGRWDAKPTAACDEGSANGVRSEDGSTWSFALTGLLFEGLLDIVVVPGTVDDAPDGANGSTFQLAFEPVTSSDLQTSSGGSSDGGSFDVPSLAEFGADVGGGFGDDLGAPALSSFTPPLATGAFKPSLGEDEQGLTATAPSVQRKNPVLPLVPASADEGADTRLLGMVVLGLAAVLALGTAREPLPPPRLLGRFAAQAGPATVASAPAMGGLGRFARPRTGPTPRL